MTRKQLYIIITTIVLAALIAASIAVPILIINNISKVPNPTFANFDQLSDMTIDVEWKKVSKSKSYDIEYCYGNPQATNAIIVTGRTESTFFTIERKKGVLNVRVRASFEKEKGAYSPWVLHDINAIKLSSPVVTISDSLMVSWSEVKYKYYTTKKSVPLYCYEINIKSAEEDYTIENMDTDLKSVSIYDYIILYLGNYDYTQKNWNDLTVTFMVKAVNYSKIGSSKITVGEYKFVYDVYDESDYTASSYTLTLQDYQRIKGI